MNELSGPEPSPDKPPALPPVAPGGIDRSAELEQGQTIDPALLAPIWLLFILVGYIFITILIALVLLVDCWANGLTLIRSLFRIPESVELPELLKLCMFSVSGAMLGAAALDIVSFHRHAGIRRDFQTSHSWGYFLAPWLAVVLGILVFALVQSGLFVFNGGSVEDGSSDIRSLGNFAMGFLVGYGWYHFLCRVQRMIQRFFGSKAESTTNEIARDADDLKRPKTMIKADID